MNKKRLWFVAALIAVLCACFSLGCKKKATEEPPAPAPAPSVTEYTVTFDANGGVFDSGSQTYTEKVASGKCAVGKTPTYDEHIFCGWYTERPTGEADSSLAINIAISPINANLTYFAGWKARAITGIHVSAPAKLEYEVGDTLDITGMIVFALYNDESRSEVTDDCNVSPVDMTTVGQKTVTVTYGDFTDTFTITVKGKTEPVPQKVLQGITITTKPTKLEYEVGDSSVVNTNGMVVTADYSDGSHEAVTEYEVSSLDTTTAGDKTITVTYNTKTATFTVTVKESVEPPVPQKVLQGITITKAPDKSQYFVGDSSVVNTNGMVVTADYSDGSHEAVTEYEVSSLDTTTAGDKTITVTYNNKTATFTVTVKESVEPPVPQKVLQGITITTKPTKLEYEVGDSSVVNTNGMVVTADYSDGSHEAVTEYEVSSLDTTTAGDKTITVTYNTKTATFTVTVKESVEPPVPQKVLQGITITKAPDKSQYFVGDSSVVNTNGMVVTADYSDGSHEAVTEYEVSSLDTTTAGDKTITVTYNTKTATFTVTVKQVPATFTVTFYYNYTAQSMDTYKTVSGIAKNGKVEEPTDPEREGYTFGGWYTDRASTAAYDFNTEITTNIELYAKWTRNDPVLKSITVSPVKTTYVVNQTIQEGDLVVTAHYDWGSDVTVPFADCTVVAPAMTTPGENRQVSVTYSGITKTYNIKVIAKAVSTVELSGTCKTSYFVGDAFVPTGLSFTVTWNDDSVTYPAASLAVYTATGLTDGVFNTASESLTVSVSYNGVAADKTITVSVAEVTVSSLTFEGAPTKTEYLKGDNFLPAGLTFTATYNNGSTTHPDASADITYSSAGKMTGRKFTAVGTVQITATYEGVSAADTIDVTVTAPELAIDHWYLLGTFNSWGAASNTAEYELTVIGGAGETNYKSMPVVLEVDQQFKIARYKYPTKTGNEQFDIWIEVSDTNKLSVDPQSDLLSLDIVEDAYGNKNVKVLAVDSGVADRGWIINYTVKDDNTVKVNITLDHIDFRKPTDGSHDAAMEETDTPSNEVYLAGNFSGNFKLCDSWSSGNTAVATVRTVGEHKVYYFTKVHLNKYDRFKVVVPVRGESAWLGGDFTVLGTAINVSATGDNIYFGADIEDGFYNIVFDTNGDKVTVYEWKKVEVTVSGVYDTKTPEKSNLVVTYGGVKLSDADYDLIAQPAALGELMSRLTVIYNGVVYNQSYTAIERRIESIALTSGPEQKDYYICTAVAKTAITVTATYNNGDTRVLAPSEFNISAYTAADYAGTVAVADPVNNYYTTELTVSLVSDSTKTCKISGIKLYNHAKRLYITTSEVFYAGESVQPADLSVEIVFNEDEENAANIRESVATNAGYTVESNTLVAGANVLTVQYTFTDGMGNSLTLTGTVTVTANQVVPTGITFTEPAAKPTYRSATTFTGDGYDFTVTYNNGKTKTHVALSELKLESSYIGVDGKFINVDELTEIEITVKYTEGSTTVTATDTIKLDLDVRGDTEYSVKYYTGLNVAYTVTGVPTAAQNVRADAAPINGPESDPTAKGFNFAGWVDAEGNALSFPYKVVGDIDIYASWNAVTYNVIYQLDGGANAAANSGTYTATDLVYAEKALVGATRDYYTFAGWYTEATGGRRVTSLSYAELPATGTDITLYAHWTIITYTLEYVMGDYGTAIDNVSFNINTLATIANLPVAVEINETGVSLGQRFTGWMTAGVGGDAISVITADILPLTAPYTIRVYARYSDEYTVTFNANGGTLASSAKVTVKYGRAVGKPSDPTRAGNTFNGWTLDGEMYEFTTLVKSDITLVASWVQNPDEDGTYLRGDMNSWGSGTAYVATVNPDDSSEYIVRGVPLTAGDEFQLATYTSGVAGNWVKPASGTISSSSEPSGAVTVGAAQNDYGYNFKITALDEAFENQKWTLYVKTTGVTVKLEADNTSRNVNGVETALTAATSFDTNGLYIRGNFTYIGGSWKAVDEWSTSSSNMPTAKVGDKFYFGNVYLKNFDQFKLFIPTGATEDKGTWLGGDFTALDTPIEMGDHGNVYLVGITSGRYDLVYDSATHKLMISAAKSLTATLASPVYVGQTPTAASFAFTYDGAALDDTQAANVTLATPAAAVAGANASRVVAVYDNTVAKINYTATAVAATGITVETGAGFKTAYSAGEAFDATGLTVKLIFNDGSEQALAYGTGYTVSAIPAKANVIDSFVDTQSVTLTVAAVGYTGAAFEKTISITLKNVFTGIEITSAPTKSTYYEGETFVADGLQVSAVFNTGAAVTKQVISSGYTYTPDMNTPGSQTVVVTYSYNGHYYTASFTLNITALEVESIAVSTTGAKLTYKIGEALDTANVTVTGTYNDGNDRAVALSGCTVTVDSDHYDGTRFTSSVGKAVVTVKYADGITDTYEVTVTPLIVSYSGADVQSVSVTSYGGTITAPTGLTKAHYTFGGWYKDAQLTSEWSDSTAITVDKTLYAKWIPDEYTVTFKRNDGSTGAADIIATVTVVYSETCRLERPAADPTRDDYTFHGWSLTQEDGDYFDFENTLIGSDLIMFANWTHLPVYTVTFNSAGGSSVLQQSIISGKKATAVTPTKEGNTFVCWKLNDGTPFSFDTPITRNYTLTAEWSINDYEVTFDADGGAPAPAKQTVAFGSTLNNVSDPSKEGYEFLGWFNGASATAWNFNTDKMPAGNVTLTAHWQKLSYTLTYDLDGGVGVATDGGKILYGEKITPPSDPTKTGYTFSHWKLNNGTKWEFDDSTMPARALKLTAVWTVNSYTLRFMNDGAELSSTTVNYAAAITAPQTPVKEGHRFLGWYEDESETAWNFTVNGTMPARNLTLTAKWQKLSYTLTFVNGDESTTSSAVPYGTEITAPAATDKLGYTFAGWKDGADTYTTMPAKDLTLTATYDVNTYTLVYNVGSHGTITGDESKTFTVLTISTVATLPTVTPDSANGWKFVGWYTAAENGDLVESVTTDLIPSGAARIINVYAVYDNHYTVTFNVNKPATVSATVANPPAPVSVVYGGYVDALSVVPTLDGYVLASWHTDTTCVSEPWVFDEDGNTVTSDITLYAKWTKAPAEEGVYLLGTFNGWDLADDNIMAYKATVSTENGADKYSIHGIHLTANDTLKFVEYKNKASDYKDPYGRTVYTGSGLTVEIDTNHNNNLLVKSITPVTQKDTWSIYWGMSSDTPSKPYVSFVLDPRDPSFGDNLVTNESTATADVYIRGSMTNGFELSPQWSNASTLIDVVYNETANTYYFQKVYLTPSDRFKVYDKGSDKWYGYDNLTTGNGVVAITTTDSDRNIKGLPSADYYNIVYNATSHAVSVFKWAVLTSELNNTLYGDEQPEYDDLTVSFGNASVSVTAAMLYSVDGATKTYKVLYHGQIGEFTYETTPVAPESIAIKTMPANINYTVGGTVDLTGIVVTVTRNNGTTYEVDASSLTVSAIPVAAVGTAANRIGSYDVEVTVTLSGTTITAPLTVKVSNVLSNIAITRAANKTSFVQYTAVDYTGIQITATFNENTAAECTMVITDLCTFAPASGSELTTVSDSMAVTVSYGGKSTSYNITVTEPKVVSVAFTGTVTKTYKVGDRFDKTDSTLAFTATYDNGRTAPADIDLITFATANSALSNGSGQFTAAGNVVLVATYNENITVTGNIVASVSDKVTGIEVATYPNVTHVHSTNWVVGDTYSIGGMKLRVTYNGGIDGAESYTSVVSGGFTVDLANTVLTTAGSVTATITCGGITKSYNITVDPKMVVSVAVSGSLTNTSYTVGDVFNAAGLSFTATYNNDDTGALSASAIAFEWAGKNAAGQFTAAGTTVTVTAKCESITVGTYTVSVVNKLTSIAVTTLPPAPTTPAGHINSWVAGDTLSLVGAVVTLTYNEGIDGANSDITSDVTITAENLSQFSADLSTKLAAGNNVYEITYNGITAEFTVPAVAKALTGFTVTGTPAEQYLHGTFNTSGLTFKAQYNNGTEETVSAGITFTSTAFDSNNTFKTSGSATVVATYNGFTANITVTVTNNTRYTVTFDSAGGSDVESQSVLEGGSATRPTNPTRRGYTFVNWQLNGSDYAFASAVTGNITLVAVWNAKTTYTVAFVLDGGTITFANPLAYTATDNVFGDVALGEATKEHYTFKGWYRDSSFNNKVEKLEYSLLEYANSSDVITLYAKFEANTYTVTFSHNDGTGWTTTQNITYPGKATAISLERAGYTITSWNKGDVTGAAWDFDNPITENMRLVANWTPIGYTITLNANSGTVSPASLSVNVLSDAAARTLPTPIRTGYAFKGWYDNAELSGTSKMQVTFANGEPEASAFYAKWEIITRTVTLNSNGGSLSSATMSLTIESTEQARTLPATTRTGYTFKGWFEDEDFSGDAVTVVTFNADGTLTSSAFYAKWEATDVTITLHANEGTVTPGSLTLNCESSESDRTLPTPTRAGYEFKGWFTRSDLSDTAVTAVVFTNGAAASRDYYAKWEAKEYTVNYVVGEGCTTTNPPTYKVTDNGGDPIALSAPTAPSGKRFVKWTQGVGGATITELKLDAFGSGTSINVVAVYEDDEFTVTFSAGDGKFESVADGWTLSNDGKTATVTVTGGTAVTAADVPTPVRLRYSHSGWTKNGTAFALTTQITEDTTLVASWTARSYDDKSVYVDDVIVGSFKPNGTSTTENKAVGIVVQPGQIVGFYNESGTTVINGTKWLKFSSTGGGKGSDFAADNVYGGLKLTATSTKAYKFYYQKAGGGTVYIESDVYTAPEADLGGVYNGTEELKAFELNLGNANALMAKGVVVGNGANDTTKYEITLMYGGTTAAIAKLEYANGVAVTKSDNTLYLFAGTYDFYYSYAKDSEGNVANRLYIAGTTTGNPNSGLTYKSAKTNNAAFITGDIKMQGTTSFDWENGYQMTLSGYAYNVKVYLTKGDVVKVRVNYNNNGTGLGYNKIQGTKPSQVSDDGSNDHNIVINESGYYTFKAEWSDNPQQITSLTYSIT